MTQHKGADVLGLEVDKQEEQMVARMVTYNTLQDLTQGELTYNM